MERHLNNTWSVVEIRMAHLLPQSCIGQRKEVWGLYRHCLAWLWRLVLSEKTSLQPALECEQGNVLLGASSTKSTPLVSNAPWSVSTKLSLTPSIAFSISLWSASLFSSFDTGHDTYTMFNIQFLYRYSSTWGRNFSPHIGMSFVVICRYCDPLK